MVQNLPRRQTTMKSGGRCRRLCMRGFSVAVVAVLFYYDLLFTTFTLCAHIFVALIGIYLGVSWALVQGKQYVPPALPKEHQHSHVRLILQNMIVSLTLLERNLIKMI
ncbi:hypothetical protein MAR_022273 [Mya arenaria]|uniref:Uncharacterized protein n=1 Tax=Mya arenaria TaxID=6604 RepID=A0ABY7DNF7_MYAAR|nr:hypothetical protein MAR_022273 [Mya arenaria]